MKEMDMHHGEIIYAVLRLNTTITTKNPLTGKDEDIELKGCAGYIPVFDTIEEAESHASNGKYKIFAIQKM